MRVATGLGLVVVVGLVACSATTDDAMELAAARETSEDNGASEDSGPVTSVDPTEPALPEEPEDPTSPDAPPGPLLGGIAITDVAVFQAVKVPVVERGRTVPRSARSAPVVADRPGLIRVYVSPEPGWEARDVTAELRLVGGETAFPVIRETKRVGAASSDEDPSSAFDLEIPAESLPHGASFQVALTGEGGSVTVTSDTDARYPRDGSFEDIGTELSGKLKIVLVPVRYDADGSGRLPDLGPAQLELYKKTMMAWYPASEIELTTRAPYPWSTRIDRNGSGFQEVLRAMLQLRQQDNAERDVYYYGVFSPSASFTSYCQGGCVTGLSTIVDRDTPSMRASIGLGFAGRQSAETMAHEIGHAHGREHAPCGGAQGVDRSYPYQGASIGVWGYDIFDKTFIAPSKGRDMMGYCSNQWVSDYTYGALFDRMSMVNVAKHVAAAPLMSRPVAKKSYLIATVDGTGAIAWDGDIELGEELQGGSVREARFLSESGAALFTTDAHFFRFDHLPGGFVFVPASNRAAWKAVSIEGFANALDR